MANAEPVKSRRSWAIEKKLGLGRCKWWLYINTSKSELGATGQDRVRLKQIIYLIWQGELGSTLEERTSVRVINMPSPAVDSGGQALLVPLKSESRKKKVETGNYSANSVENQCEGEDKPVVLQLMRQNAYSPKNSRR